MNGSVLNFKLKKLLQMEESQRIQLWESKKREAEKTVLFIPFCSHEEDEAFWTSYFTDEPRLFDRKTGECQVTKSKSRLSIVVSPNLKLMKNGKLIICQPETALCVPLSRLDLDLDLVLVD